jgi:signal transduction histidine kinase
LTRVSHSLRTRLVVTFVATLLLLQVGNAAYLLINGRASIRGRLEAGARQFAVLATPALGQSFDSYFESGYFKFRQFVLDLLGRSDEVTAIRICDVEGRVLFDSRAPAGPPGGGEFAALTGEWLDAVRRVEPSEVRPHGAGQAPFEIVVPYLEDWGIHRLSVVYHVSLDGLERQFARSVRLALGLLLVSGLLVSGIGLALGTRLTRPLGALAEGVQQVARGNYDHRVEVRSGDELQLVADAFNDMSARLQSTIGELERHNAELERFTYTVSHDLRSPLVTVLGFLGLLEKDIAAGDRESVARDVMRIRTAAARMDRMLRELLELSRVGRTDSAREDVPMAELAEEARQALAGRLEGIELEIASELPVLHGERARLLEVVQNLVDNAAKFSAGASAPKVVIGSRDGPGWPVCFVRDNGVGIDPRHHQRVFGLFERLDTNVEGTGIGLALVKRIVELHGGRVWVESDGKGLGSTFCFTLPPRGAAPPPADGGSRAPAGGAV